MQFSSVTLPKNAAGDFSLSTRTLAFDTRIVSTLKTATLSLSVRPAKVPPVISTCAPFAQNAPPAKPSLSILHTLSVPPFCVILIPSSASTQALFTCAVTDILPVPSIVTSPRMRRVGSGSPGASLRPSSVFSPASVSVLPPQSVSSVVSPARDTSASVTSAPLPTVMRRPSNGPFPPRSVTVRPSPTVSSPVENHGISYVPEAVTALFSTITRRSGRFVSS